MAIHVGTDVFNVEPREEQVLVSVNTRPFSPYNTMSQSRSPSPPIITTRNLTPALQERWQYEDAQRWDSSEDIQAIEIRDSDNDSDNHSGNDSDIDAIEISDSDSDETFFEENVTNEEPTSNENIQEGQEQALAHFDLDEEEEKKPGRINCPLCKDQDIPTPVALLCGHITCHDCFEKWKKFRKENRMSFECPVSRCQVFCHGIKLFHQLE